MRLAVRWLVACVAVAAAASAAWAAAGKQTVCTITVNSDDEKAAFRRHLPPGRYDFVELVERGRPDWLSASCRKAVTCDLLIISAHFDGGNDFFSDQLEASEFLTVSELERVSCSQSCPTLFSRLKEVYLFGCNTLNPAPQSSESAEIVRSLVREGHSPKDAQRQWQSLSAAQGESSRERMRQVFQGVGVIYGFSSTAPLGPVAGATLEHYFRHNGSREVATGRPASALLRQFAPFSMASARGVTARDPQASARHAMCQFADDRVPLAAKLVFMHTLLQRPTGEARPYLDRMQRLMATLDPGTRRAPAVARALQGIASDAAARARFLADARAAQQAPMRVRLMNAAHDLGWLSDDERWQELALMLGELQARDDLDVPEVNLVCSLNQHHDLDGAFNRRVVPGGAADDVAHAALRACLGSSEGHVRTVQALVKGSPADVRVAQAYLRNRPLTDPAELRRVAADIVAMSPSDAQVLALQALGRHYVSDADVLDKLVQLFTRTPSWAVQDAIAGILVRADRASLARRNLAQTVQDRRLPSPGGRDMIDALVTRLTMP